MNKLQYPIDEGWSVHIYDRQRRLLCALEPSHGWTFLSGCFLGLVLAMVWVNMAHSSPATSSQSTVPPKTPLLQVD